MSATSLPAGRPGPVDRFLRLFTDVRPGESVTALLLTLNVFLILFAYYLIRPVREALILTGAGAEVKSYAAAGQAVLLLGAVPLYGALAARLPRRRLITGVTGFFVACLALFFALVAGGTPVGIPFFLWVGVFNLMVVAQFWSFANDVYTTDEGERLFPVVAFGGSAGAFLGSLASGRLIAAFDLAPVLLVAAGVLVAALVVTNAVDGRERARTERGRLTRTTAELPAATGEFRAASGAFKQPVEARHEMRRGAAFRLVLQNRYLLLIALLVMLLNWVNTTGEYILGTIVERSAADAIAAGTAGGRSQGQLVGEFYASFLSGVSGLGALLQLFVVSRVLKYFGVRLALLVLPCIALAGYAVLALVPVLAAVRAVKTAENATDYSLQKTVSQTLFLPTTREQKYAAKQAIDAFFWRLGDVLSAALVFAGTTWLTLTVRGFALVNLVLVAVWLALAVAVGRRYRRLVADTAV